MRWAQRRNRGNLDLLPTVGVRVERVARLSATFAQWRFTHDLTMPPGPGSAPELQLFLSGAWRSPDLALQEAPARVRCRYPTGGIAIGTPYRIVVMPTTITFPPDGVLILPQTGNVT